MRFVNDCSIYDSCLFVNFGCTPKMGVLSFGHQVYHTRTAWIWCILTHWVHHYINNYQKIINLVIKCVILTHFFNSYSSGKMTHTSSGCGYVILPCRPPRMVHGKIVLSLACRTQNLKVFSMYVCMYVRMYGTGVF